MHNTNTLLIELQPFQEISASVHACIAREQYRNQCCEKNNELEEFVEQWLVWDLY